MDYFQILELCKLRPTYLLRRVFIVVVQVLLALLLFQRLTYEASHLALHPRLLPSNQEPIISEMHLFHVTQM